MTRTVRTVRTLLTVALLSGFAAPVSAGPISVFTQIWSTNGGGDELRLSGPGSYGVLTTGGGVNPVITVPANQTSGSQPGVVGFWPVLGFRDLAHYEATRGTTLTIPDTPVKLYAEVWNGEYGLTSDFRQVYIDAVISATVGTEPGQNAVNWQFPNPPVEVDFGNTKVTLSYTPVPQPDGTPLIMFDDGTPAIGYIPGNPYYPSLLTANVEVWRDPSLPTDPPVEEGPGEQPPVTGTPPDVPEPSSALLLAGLAFGGFAARRPTMRSAQIAKSLK